MHVTYYLWTMIEKLVTSSCTDKKNLRTCDVHDSSPAESNKQPATQCYNSPISKSMESIVKIIGH